MRGHPVSLYRLVSWGTQQNLTQSSVRWVTGQGVSSKASVVDLHCSRSVRAADIQTGPDIAVNAHFISVRLSSRAQKDSVLLVQCRE